MFIQHISYPMAIPICCYNSQSTCSLTCRRQGRGLEFTQKDYARYLVSLKLLCIRIPFAPYINPEIGKLVSSNLRIDTYKPAIKGLSVICQPHEKIKRPEKMV